MEILDHGTLTFEDIIHFKILQDKLVDIWPHVHNIVNVHQKLNQWDKTIGKLPSNKKKIPNEYTNTMKVG